MFEKVQSRPAIDQFGSESQSCHGRGRGLSSCCCGYCVTVSGVCVVNSCLNGSWDMLSLWIHVILVEIVSSGMVFFISHLGKYLH